MKAKNKADYLKGLEILEVWVPVYYNGKPLDTHYATFEYSKESNSFEYTENKYSNNSLGNKSYVEKVLMANYEVFHTAKIGELCFVLIQKDGEDFVKYVDEAYFFDISEIDLNAKNSDPIYKEFHDWFFKREFTVAEIEYICKTIQNGNS